MLKLGSTGSAVEQVQFWLSTLSNYYSSIPAVTVDGSYGAATRTAVMKFQEEFGLAVDGIVGQNTWNALFDEYQSIQTDIGTPNKYPGTPVKQGDTGNYVKSVQFWLRIAKSNYSSLNDVSVDGVFGAATKAAVIKFQSYFGLTADGIVGQNTWNKLYEVYNDIANKLLSSDLRPGEYPGVLKKGSTGTPVRELQYYLYLIAAFEPSIPTVSIDGVFGTATENSVKAFQQLAGLTVDGIVGQTTWNTLYATASRLRLSAPVFTVERLSYPGTPLQEGDTGDAVLYYSTLIDRIAYYFYSVQSAGQTSTFTAALTTATKSFQTLEGLPATGIVNEATWLAAEALSLTLLANAEPTDTLAVSDEYPGYAAKTGSAGAHVKLIQQWLNSLGALYCEEDFVDETGVFTEAEATRVKKVQTAAGLSPNGTVDKATWDVLRAGAAGLG
ncbi:MAG: peptidoglycan-binding protein [Faecalibacterium sp.]|nr:peptidoglycan-binding protein [Faecalibacterium sp.]